MNNKTQMANSGAGYFLKGFDLINTKGVRRFVLIPLLVNISMFGVAFYHAFLQLDVYMTELESWLPEMLAWLTYLLWPLSLMLILVLYSFVFSSISNWLAAPFNGLLSEKVEARLTGESMGSGGVTDIVKDIPRTLGREWTKFIYYLPRAVGFLLLTLVPVVGQIMWFIFLSWMMAVQYKDYPFDNHKVPFNDMKNTLKQHQGLSYSFGMTTALFSMIPIVNMIVMPVAICGATALWVDRYREHYK